MLTRALIVLLLVLNLGVALWWAMREAPSAPVPAPLPAGVERLQLVGEGGAVVPEPAPPVVVTQCWRIGPFAEAAAAATASASLEPVTALVRPYRDYAGTADSWKVLLPPAATMAEAEAAAERIAAAGFSDRFVIRDGGDARAVALGLYSGEATARARAGTLQASGFAAEVFPVGAGPARHWLDVGAGAAFDPETIAATPGVPDIEPLDCATSGLAPAADAEAPAGTAR